MNNLDPDTEYFIRVKSNPFGDETFESNDWVISSGFTKEEETPTPTPTPSPTPIDNSKLYIAFAGPNVVDNALAYSSFYEVNVSNSSNRRLILQDVDGWNSFSSPDNENYIIDGSILRTELHLIDESTSRSVVHISPFSEEANFVLSGFSDTLDMMNSLDGLTIRYDSVASEFYVIYEESLNYTQFTISGADATTHGTSIEQWMSNAQVNYIFNILLVESLEKPTYPLEQSVIDNAYISNKISSFDKANCGVDSTNDKIMNMAFDVTTDTSPKLYSPVCSNNSAISSDSPWSGSNCTHFAGAGITVAIPKKNNDPVGINEFYFYYPSADGSTNDKVFFL